MRKDKKGILRILEAFIAIALIAGVLIVLYTQTIRKPQIADDVYRTERVILDEVAGRADLRSAVLNNNTAPIESFVAGRIPAGFSYSIRICRVEEICELPAYNKDTYASERVISSTLAEFKPKKLKIFMWRE